MELDVTYLVFAILVSTLGLWLTFPAGYYSVCTIYPERCPLTFYTYENFLFGYLTIVAIGSFVYTILKSLLTICLCACVCTGIFAGACSGVDEKIELFTSKFKKDESQI